MHHTPAKWVRRYGAQIEGSLACSAVTYCTLYQLSVPMGFDRTVERVGGYAVVMRMRSDCDVVLP